MTDAEIIEAMARALFARNFPDSKWEEADPYWHKLFAADAELAHAICAPAIRERCAEAHHAVIDSARKSEGDHYWLDRIEFAFDEALAAPAESKGDAEHALRDEAPFTARAIRALGDQSKGGTDRPP